jgi:hypothetical protein
MWLDDAASKNVSRSYVRKVLGGPTDNGKRSRDLVYPAPRFLLLRRRWCSGRSSSNPTPRFPTFPDFGSYRTGVSIVRGDGAGRGSGIRKSVRCWYDQTESINGCRADV